MCSVRLVRGVPVASAPERLDGDTSRQLRLALAELAERGYATLVVDLSNTRFCDQAGRAVLTRAHERACAEGGELRLVGTRRASLQTFSPCGVARPPRRFASLDEAVAELPAAAIAPAGGPAGTIAWLIRDNPHPRIRRPGRPARPRTAAGA
jgi:anti-anti-sigma factor